MFRHSHQFLVTASCVLIVRDQERKVSIGIKDHSNFNEKFPQ